MITQYAQLLTKQATCASNVGPSIRVVQGDNRVSALCSARISATACDGTNSIRPVSLPVASTLYGVSLRSRFSASASDPLVESSARKADLA